MLLPVYYDGPFQAIALQGGFRFDTVQGRLAEVLPNADAGISLDCFGLSEIGSGALRFVWYSERPEQLLPSGTLLFTLRLDLQDEAKPPDIWGSENVLAPLVYSITGTELPVTTQSKQQ